MSSTMTKRDPEMQKLNSPSPVEDKTNPPKSSDGEYDADQEKPQTSRFKAFWSCVLYSFCSVSMVLVNKSLASRYET